MDSPHLSLLKWSTSFLVLSGYLALAAVGSIGPAILVIPLVVLALTPLAERLDRKYAGYGVVSRAVTIAYCCFLPLSWINLGLMTAVVTLAIFIQCYTLLHRKTPRNYYHLYLMSLFLLLAACVQSPEPIIGFVMLMFLVSAVWANITLRIVLEESRLPRPTEPEFVSLDFMKHHSDNGTATGQRRILPLTGSLIAFAIVLLTALSFVLTPRMEAGILGRNQTVVETTGLSESVDLQSGSTIREDDTPVMMVQFPDEADGQIEDPEWLYWRVTTYNVYRNNSWSSRETRLVDPGITLRGGQRRSERDRYRVERTMRPNTRLIRQTIYMDDVPAMGVPALDLVQRIWADEKAKGVELTWASDRDLTVRMNKTGARRLNYEAWSEPGDPDPETLRTAPLDFSDVGVGDFELFTDHSLSQQSVELARSLTQNETTLYDKVVAIESYLSGPNYLYTLSIPEMEGESIVDVFINQTRRGHCELFSTALVLMLRSQGIPSRVVTGFRGGEWNESDETYTIRANMAHLWTEVWFPKFGWVIFDPSPREDDRDRSHLDRLSLLVSRSLLKTKIFWYQEVVGFDRRTQFEKLRNFSVGLVEGAREDRARRAESENVLIRFGFVVPLVVFVAIVVATVMAIRRITWMRVPRNVVLTIDQVRVVRLYLLLRRQLQRYGVSCAGKTAEDLLEELQSGQWINREAAEEVLSLYNTVRFGHRPVTGTNLGELRKSLSKLCPINTDLNPVTDSGSSQPH